MFLQWADIGWSWLVYFARNLRAVVIDSMNSLLNAMPHEQFLAMQLHELLAFLGQQGIAALLTVAQHGFIGTTNTPIDVSYLAELCYKSAPGAQEVC